MKRLTLGGCILLLLSLSAWAQEVRQGLTIQGSGFFPKETTESGIASKPTYSGGVLAGYRFNINGWLAVEGNYDYFRNSQKYSTSAGSAFVPTSVHAVTGLAVFKIPTSGLMKYYLRPYALAGGGAMIFDPRDTNSVSKQTRGSLVYGAGADMPLARHIAIRVEYRGLVYKVPDFGLSPLRVNKFTHAAVPSAGLVFTF
jgi:opacity protein-like surface antigen